MADHRASADSKQQPLKPSWPTIEQVQFEGFHAPQKSLDANMELNTWIASVVASASR
jgi:hypothetical protein